MKYTSFIALATIAFFSSCSSCTKDRNGLPANPTNNQVYRDANGHSWIYDAIMMRWALSGVGGNTYYYYPSSGSYTNSVGTKVTPPPSVSSGISPKSNAVPKSSKGAVFGSSGRSHSISA